VREDIEADSDQDIQINKVKLNLVGEIARRLGDQFNADNPRFDFSRFEKWVFNQFPHIKERS
jgi:hypothetical protein